MQHARVDHIAVRPECFVYLTKQNGKKKKVMGDKDIGEAVTGCLDSIYLSLELILQSRP